MPTDDELEEMALDDPDDHASYLDWVEEARAEAAAELARDYERIT